MAAADNWRGSSKNGTLYHFYRLVLLLRYPSSSISDYRFECTLDAHSQRAYNGATDSVLQCVFAISVLSDVLVVVGVHSFLSDFESYSSDGLGTSKKIDNWSIVSSHAQPKKKTKQDEQRG